jgi:long-chain acyl-CoA synthetase
MTIPQLVDAQEKRIADHVMLQKFEGGRFRPVTYREVRTIRLELAAGLHHRGIRKGDRVAIISQTRFEWGALDLAILSLGAVTVGIYPTTTPEQVRYILGHSKTKLCLREANVAEVPGAILINDEALGELRAEGRVVLAHEPDLIERLQREVKPEDVATLVYTSGTTGMPKGAILTHGALHDISKLGIESLDVSGSDVGVSYLPMAHVLTRVNYYGSIHVGAIAFIADGLDKIADAWKAAHPTVVSAVPRVLEKVKARILAGVAAASPTKQKLFARAFATGAARAALLEKGAPVPLGLRVKNALWDRLVFRKVRASLGWDRIRFVIAGGAPIPLEVMRFFHALGVLVTEGYGLTETSSPVTLNTLRAHKFGTVGKPIKGVQLRLAEDGEIEIQSPGLFKGYESDPEATAAAFAPDGWFRTGDIGTIDAEGFLKITDRKKDLIITAGGKNIAPANIEAVIKEDPRVSQVLVHGDRRAYLVALVTLEETALAAARAAEPSACGAFDENGATHRAIADAITAANAKLARYETIKGFRVLTDDLTVENGGLTPTLKVKRRAVEKANAALLDGLYDEKALRSA